MKLFHGQLESIGTGRCNTRRPFLYRREAMGDADVIEILKIVHLLSLAVALGMTTANLVTMRYVGGVDAAARPAFGPLGRSFGAYGVMAVALLWVTGIALLLLKYDVSGLPGWFTAKLVFVVILTALVISARKVGAKAIAGGTPPPMPLMWQITSAMLASGVLIVVCAVLAFN